MIFTLVGWNPGTPESTCAPLAASRWLRTVSYTHLDVYKRQVQSYAARADLIIDVT